MGEGHFCPIRSSRSPEAGAAFPPCWDTLETSRVRITIITVMVTLPTTSRHSHGQQHYDQCPTGGFITIGLRGGNPNKPTVGWTLMPSQHGGRPSSFRRRDRLTAQQPLKSYLPVSLSGGVASCLALGTVLASSRLPFLLPPSHAPNTCCPTPFLYPDPPAPLQPSLAHQLHLGPQTFQDPVRSFRFLLWGKEKNGIKQGL